MKAIGFLSIVCALAAATPAFAHEGWYGRPHFVHPGHRVVVVRPPIFAPRPVVVVRPAPVYYAPAPVYYAAPAYPEPVVAATVGGAIAGAAIGAIASNGRPGAIAAGSVIGAVVGNGLAR
ncbi:MAG TPA: hypothetical protein VJO54_05645 [Burkholderiales bacterium]|nr:hypothetical protein [Burkholderiales bacterium]